MTDVAADFVTTLSVLRRHGSSLISNVTPVGALCSLLCMCGEILTHIASELPAPKIICVASSCKRLLQELTEDGLVSMLAESPQFMNF